MRNYAYAILYGLPEEHLYGAVWDDISFALPNEWNRTKPANTTINPFIQNLPSHRLYVYRGGKLLWRRWLVRMFLSYVQYFHSNYPKNTVSACSSSHGFAPSNCLIDWHLKKFVLSLRKSTPICFVHIFSYKDSHAQDFHILMGK